MPNTITLGVQLGDSLDTLAQIEAALGDATPLMQDLLLLMIRSTQLNFEAQGRPLPWAPHAESTIRRRFGFAMKQKGAKAKGTLAVLGSIWILRDQGLLAQSVGGGASGPFQSADGFGASDEHSAVIGTNRPGWQNQFDDSRGWREARPFILWQDQDEEDAGAMGMDWIMRTGPYAA
jgi:phage gpG-like protein